MKIDVPEGAIPAPDELDAVKAPETSEPEVKTEAEPVEKTEAEPDQTESAEAEGEKVETPEAPKAEPAEEEPESDDQQADKETKSQRKRRLRREREEQLRAEVERKDKEIADLKRREAALKDEDPNAADNYDAALAQNIVNRTLRAQTQAQIDAVQAERERVESEAKEAARAAWDEQVAELAHIKDFAQKVYDPNVPFTSDVAAAITQMERGPEIAYALANDHERLKRLAKLPLLQLGAELARIEAGLTLPKPKLQSSAPAPLKILKGSTTPPDVNLETADYDTYKKLRGLA